MPTVENQPSRINEFDGLRGLLAWWVVIGHVLYSFGNDWGEWSGNNFAVHVFIILSGFVITYLLDTTKEKYTVYIARRWFRIYPVYFVLLVFCSFIGGLEKAAVDNGLFFAGNEEHEALSVVFNLQLTNFWPHFLAQLFLLQGMFPISVLPQADSSMLSPAWSLSLEWQYYMVAPFIVWALSSTKRWVFLFIFLFILLCGRLVPGFKVTAGFLPVMMFYFGVGIGSYYLWKERETKALRTTICWFLALFMLDQALRGEVGTVIWIIVFASISGLAPSFAGTRVRSVLNNPVLQKMGTRSYPVYIGHMPIYLLALYCAQPLSGVPVLWGIFIVVASVTGTYWVAEFLHNYVEVPCIRFGRKVTEGISLKAGSS